MIHCIDEQAGRLCRRLWNWAVPGAKVGQTPYHSVTSSTSKGSKTLALVETNIIVELHQAFSPYVRTYLMLLFMGHSAARVK